MEEKSKIISQQNWILLPRKAQFHISNIIEDHSKYSIRQPPIFETLRLLSASRQRPQKLKLLRQCKCQFRSKASGINQEKEWRVKERLHLQVLSILTSNFKNFYQKRGSMSIFKLITICYVALCLFMGK